MTRRSKKKPGRMERVGCVTGACLTLWLMIAEVRGQDFTYATNNGTITITGSPGDGLVGVVSIPSTINGLPVVAIGDGAFVTNFYLTSVTVPGSVTNIGANAFDACEELTNLTLLDGLIAVGDGAFGNCVWLTSVTIPNGVTRIGDDAFTECWRLSDVSIPRSVVSIGGSAFSVCVSLTNVTIPSGVTYIAGNTFAQCTALTNVIIPDSVTNIGDTAFAYCLALRNVTIPGSVTKLGADAFGLCSNLVSVYFKGNAPTLGQDISGNTNTAFEEDPVLTVYYLPATKGWGATFGGAPTKLWNPQALTTDASFGVRQNRFGFNIMGTPNIPLVVEACTSLAAESWLPLQSCTLTNGSVYFSDPQWTNLPCRFYRIRSP